MSFIDAIKDTFYAMGIPEDAQLDAQVYFKNAQMIA